MLRRAVLMMSASPLLWLAGCKATPPGPIETAVVTYAEHHILIGNRNQKNPLPDTPGNRADGKEAFTYYCVACHGMDGQNTGVPFARHLSPPVPSLASRDVQSYTDGQLKWILDYGIWPSGMPGSKGTLSSDELWSIVLFLRHLPPAGSQGIPRMYGQ
ncbi:MAG: c-type cytochrome [Acidobacteriota bacterium]